MPGCSALRGIVPAELACEVGKPPGSTGRYTHPAKHEVDEDTLLRLLAKGGYTSSV